MKISPQSLFADYHARLDRRDASAAASSERGSFVDLLSGGVQNVNDSQQQAAQSIQTLLTGGDIDTAEVVVDMQKADMAFRMLLQVRNKLMKAYEDIQAIQV